MISASTRVLIGAPVVDIHNTVIGKIEDLIVDLRTGCMAYAVLSLEHSLPHNGRLGSVVLPWNRLVLDRAENTFTLDVETDLLLETDLLSYYTDPSCEPC